MFLAFLALALSKCSQFPCHDLWDKLPRSLNVQLACEARLEYYLFLARRLVSFSPVPVVEVKVKRGFVGVLTVSAVISISMVRSTPCS